MIKRIVLLAHFFFKCGYRGYNKYLLGYLQENAEKLLKFIYFSSTIEDELGCANEKAKRHVWKVHNNE